MGSELFRSRIQVLAGLGFMLFAAALLQILACVLYNNWWPMLTGLMYIMIPMPCLFFGGGSADFISSSDAGDWADAAKFLTGFCGVGSIAIPSILFHAGLIQAGAMCMVFASSFMLLCTLILFSKDNIFEWQFAICGPKDSEFEGGIYHGRIQLSPEYPFKPPSFMLLTPNGRFETQTKICLSISQYHPEHWQPSWSVRTALVALIAFMPTKGNGAIGSLEFTKEERKALALKSVEAPPKYGNSERQKLIDEIHEQMIQRTQATRAPQVADNEVSRSDIGGDESRQMSENNDSVELSQAPTLNGVQVSELILPAEIANVEAPNAEPRAVIIPPPVRATTRQQASDDQFLTLLAIGLVVALAALLLRKFYHSFSWISFKQ